MANLYFIGRNHMDLTWRRCFERYYDADGYIIRPYTEFEERLLDGWMDFIEQSGGVYEIEQTATLRKYLERNPDRTEKIKSFIKSGNLRILGGGESVIDYNMPDGESIIRNHFYSRRYLKRNFDYTPRFAALPDTFGMSGGLPQLFRQLGYTGISGYNRVFADAKPVWEGISGDKVALETAHTVHMAFGDCVKYPACSACHGEGCPVCSGSGFDINYRHFDAGMSRKDFLNHIHSFRQSHEGDLVVCFASEEILEPDDLYELLQKAARENGYELRFCGVDDVIAKRYGELLRMVESDTVPTELIDPRREGNPVGTGCYTSRIRIKQENRRMEAALQAAERMNVLALPFGVEYPRKTLEKLWNRLAVFQFHDALPASHSDDASAELIDMACEIRTAAGRLTDIAAKRILPHITVPPGQGVPFVVFNPLNFAVRAAALQGVIRMPKDTESLYGHVLSPTGDRLPVLSVRRCDNLADTSFLVTFTGDLPALGYAVFRFEEAPSDTVSDSFCDTIENQRYRISLSRCGIEEIYDKALCCVIAKDGVCAPLLEEDVGHLWGRIGARGYSERADRPFFQEFMTPSPDYRTEVHTEKGEGFERAVVHVTYSRHEEELERLDWTLRVTLTAGAEQIAFHIDTAWKARNLRLLAQFPLDFTPENGKALYEIPLGGLERTPCEEYDQQLGYADDYAALRYLCVRHEARDYSVGLFNRGTPAHRIAGNRILVSLLRSPTRILCGIGIDHAREEGERHFDFALASWTGTPDKGCPYDKGWAFNMDYPTYSATPQNGELPGSATLLRLPCNAALSALKAAEDGDGVICRYFEPYGGTQTLIFEKAAEEVDILEEKEIGTAAGFSLKPYEIKTFRIDRRPE